MTHLVPSDSIDLAQKQLTTLPHHAAGNATTSRGHSVVLTTDPECPPTQRAVAYYTSDKIITGDNTQPRYTADDIYSLEHELAMLDQMRAHVLDKIKIKRAKLHDEADAMLDKYVSLGSPGTATRHLAGFGVAPHGVPGVLLSLMHSSFMYPFVIDDPSTASVRPCPHSASDRPCRPCGLGCRDDVHVPRWCAHTSSHR